MRTDSAFDLLKARIDAYQDGPTPSEVKVRLEDLRKLIEDLEQMYLEVHRQDPGAAH